MKKCITVLLILISFLSVYGQTIEEKKAFLLKVVSYRESRNGLYRENKADGSAGLLGIRAIMVKEVNTILGYNKYKLNDRLDDKKAIEMFFIYQDFVNPKYDIEVGCKKWNGGRKGDLKKSTNIYWKAVLKDGIYKNK